MNDALRHTNDPAICRGWAPPSFFASAIVTPLRHTCVPSRLHSSPRMYTATFTFAKGEYADEFHALDSAISDVARSIDGYMGEESWENVSTGLISNVYYWKTLEALRELVDHPAHRIAKQRQAEWLEGYHIVIAQVVESYGDGRIGHPLAQATRRRIDR